MSVSIVMPWRDLGCPHRRAAFDFVTAYWRRHLPEAELVVSGGPEPFSRAAALNAAVEQASGDVLFEVGPDGIVTPTSVAEAIKLAGESDGLVVCHDRYFHVGRHTTDRLLALGLDGAITAEEGRRFYVFFDAEAECDELGTTSVDVACFSRATWEQAGGYEERFGVWGGDDGAFALACGSLVAEQRRVRGDWLHLWHPRRPESIPGNPGYVEQFSILKEYVEAAEQGPEAMRELIQSR